jgi:LCP family protein required for cell wall assembly
MYVSGSDTRDYYLSTSRSDVNILMVVNPETKMVLLVNTPRDYYVANPAGNGAKDKLTHCGIYGIGCSVDALEILYDTEVRYYSQINFTGVETLVDAIGGIDVYSDYGFYALEVYWINQGWNHLDGHGARLFAQDRYSHSAGDNARGRNQMKVIQAVISKVTSGTTIIENYAGILESIQGMFRTNVSMDEIGELVKMQLGDMASWTIRSYAVSGYGGSDITYSMPGLYCYVMYPDEAKVAYGQELIQRVLDGEVLTEEDMVCPN